MKQIFLSGAGGVELLEVPAPVRLPDSVLVRNLFSLISTGTEGAAITRNSGLLGLVEKGRSSTHRIQQVWEMARRQGLNTAWNTVKTKLEDLSPLGYSCVGEVVEVDHERLPYRPGQLVACFGTGYASHAEFVTVPKNLTAPLPPDLPVEQAAFAAVACIALQGIRRLELTPGEKVGVIGLGLIGQVCVRLLAAFGHSVYGIDLDPRRANCAAAVPGITAWSLSACDSKLRIAQETAGQGLDAVIVCAATQSSQPVNLAFELCRPKGRVSLVGDVGLSLERHKMYRKEIDLRMSCSYGPGRYDDAYELRGVDYPIGQVRWTERRNLECFLDLLRSGRLDLAPLVSDRVTLERANEAYARIKDPRAETYGVLLTYPLRASTASPPERVIRPTYHPAGTIRRSHEGQVRVALIGVGGYARAIHLPNLQRLKDDFSIMGFASRSGVAAATAARRYQAPLATSDYRRLLDEKDIDAVLVATRHATHAQIVLDCLEAGKHVFVEKPMATTIEDCRKIEELAARTGLVVRVGFNRRFAPALTAMREAIGSEGVRMVSCRVNIGDVTSHWSNTPEEGGRLLGEGVHFFDFCNWIINEEPTSLSASFAGPVDISNPNSMIQIAYPSGSIAHIVYTAIGDPGLGKERYEAFGNGRTVVCDDYKLAKAFGTPLKLNRRLLGDKGHSGVLKEFSSAIRMSASAGSGANAHAGTLATQMALSVLTSARRNSSVRTDDNAFAA